MLRRFWFEFEPLGRPSALNLGCGVTAFDREDAEQILQDRIFGEGRIPKVRRLVEDVRVSDLDAGHVTPNIGVVTQRGVWFPLGL